MDLKIKIVNIMIQLKASNYELEKFYSYSSIVIGDEIYNIDDSDKQDIIIIHNFYNELCRQAFELSGENIAKFADNKTVFKIRHINTGAELYVGYKDGVFSIGHGAYILGGKTYSFADKTWSDYLSDVRDFSTNYKLNK